MANSVDVRMIGTVQTKALTVVDRAGILHRLSKATQVVYTCVSILVNSNHAKITTTTNNNNNEFYCIISCYALLL